MSTQPAYPIAPAERAAARPVPAARTRARTLLGWFWRWGLYVVAIVGSIVMAFPLLWMISTSFKTNAEANSSSIVWVPAQPQAAVDELRLARQGRVPVDCPPLAAIGHPAARQ